MTVRQAVGGWALGMLLVGPVLAEEAARPRCTRRNVGQLWPLEANTNRELARELLHCGQLDVCAAVDFRFRWRPLSVTLEQLEHPDVVKAKTGSCAAQADASGTK